MLWEYFEVRNFEQKKKSETSLVLESGCIHKIHSFDIWNIEMDPNGEPFEI